MMEELFNGHGWKLTLEEAALPDGRKSKKVRAQHSDVAHILAFDDEGKMLILREFRPFYNEWVWMIPSGHIDKEKNSADAAVRELQEETGFKANTIEFLWEGKLSERLKMTNYYYHATGLSHDPLPQDEDELIEVHHLTPEEAVQKITHSLFTHIPSAYGLLRWIKENS